MSDKIQKILIYSILVLGMLLIMEQTVIAVPKVVSIYQAWQILKTDYVKKEDLHTEALYLKVIKGAIIGSFDPKLSFSEGAIKSMLEAVDDPYTTYLDKQNNLNTKKYLTGDYVGIGVRLVINKDNQIMVFEPIPGSPADKASIKAGDIVYQIDGQSTAGFTLIQVRDKLLGKEDTEVTVVVGQNESNKNTVVLKRKVIPTVVSEIIDDQVIYLRIYSFSVNTADDVRSQLNELLTSNSNIKGIVIDLRDNPGGLVSSVIDIASEFLSKDTVVFYEANSKMEVQTTYASSGDGIAEDLNLRIAVIINNNSASASEILAGALSDRRDNTTLIGITSYGKGSVNHFLQLKDGSAFVVTSSYWLTPNGTSISQKGIMPDVVISDSNEQLNRAIAYIEGNI
ncbi:MAG: S41 family peptidase [Chloroflexi bacterium]|nr:S41 family peptidase [Chloroflexota bacterium]